MAEMDDDELSGDFRDHHGAVERWLEENTRRYSGVHSVHLSHFRWQTDDALRVSFEARFWPNQAAEEYLAYADGAGEIQLQPPMFWSPLGAPASYAAIELDDAVSKALFKGVRSALPRLKPFGIDKETGAHIDNWTPLSGRLSENMADIKRRIEMPTFSVTVVLAPLQVIIDQ